ncbi:hypothetical protein JCM15831A_13370 [Asaia astilbis]
MSAERNGNKGKIKIELLVDQTTTLRFANSRMEIPRFLLERSLAEKIQAPRNVTRANG